MTDTANLKQSSAPPPFRLDINGLRAIAVSMVVIYHFKYQFGYGGFAGVDVFFVISGFLMNEIYKKSEAFWPAAFDFYSRRFKRIYPALFVFATLSFLVLLPLSTPSALRSLAYETVAALTFSSNIFYWKTTSGYFGASADSFALLHTWSLSLEWQFYLAFPFIILLTRIARRILPAWIIYLAAASASLALCLIFAPKFQNASFYLLPTRAWELLLGALASALPYRNRWPRLTEAGALFCIVSFFLGANDASNWPGPLTLVPTVATALLLHANVGNGQSLLRYKPFQRLGDSSYSIYLAHWPVAHLYYALQIPNGAFASAAGIGASLLIGMAGYRLIEKRVRVRPATLMAAGLAACVAVVSLQALSPARLWLTDSQLKLDSYANYVGSARYRDQFGNAGSTCFLSSGRDDVDLFSPTCAPAQAAPSLLIIGDSHAAQLSRAVKDAFPQHMISQVTASGCLPFPNSKGAARCVKLMDKFYSEILPNRNFDIILITAHWHTLATDSKTLPSDISDAVVQLSKSSSRVYVLGQTKMYDRPFYKLLQAGFDPRTHEISEVGLLNRRLASALGEDHVNYIDVYDSNCISGKCTYVSENGEPFMFDDNHLTPYWATNQVLLVKSLMEQDKPLP